MRDLDEPSTSDSEVIKDDDVGCDPEDTCDPVMWAVNAKKIPSWVWCLWGVLQVLTERSGWRQAKRMKSMKTPKGA